MTLPYGRGSVRAATLLMASACACLAAVGNLRGPFTTATQAVIAYDAPDGNACIIQLSQSSSFTPLALDVDPGTFINSNSDLARPSTVTSGLTRTVLLGQRTAQLATAGPYAGVRHFSRALQAFTTYFGQITCPSTGDYLTFNFITANIPLGQTYGDPWLSDPVHPGDQPWPEWVGGLTPESFIDPLTGTLQYRIGLRGNNPNIWNLKFGSAFNQGQVTPCDAAGPWTSPCSVTAASGSTTVGNSTVPLVLRPPMSTNNPWYTNYGEFWSLDQIGLSLTGLVNSTTTAFRVLDVCLSLNGGISCASPVQQMTMGQTSAIVTLGDAPVNYWSPSTFGVDEWMLDTNPRLNSQESSAHSGTATVTNNSGTYTVTNNNTGDAFSLYWITGGNGTIRLSSNNDACTTPPANTSSTEYRIASFTDGSNIVLAAGSTPPTGTSINWCENNFTFMVWRDKAPTDGSTVTLTAAVLNALGSAAPAYPDNGAGTACFNQLVYGGYFCLFGNLFWVNPTGPAVAYYGQPTGAGQDGSGNPIANSWTRTTAPIGESASIDQTQSNLTFYMIAYDPARTSPLVIQGVFNPGSTPSQPTAPQANAQIQNATVSSTTAYSVNWNNGLAFTNLTPESTVAESVFQQMASFDPTFVAADYSILDCGLSGAVTQGVFFFACDAIGDDKPAWIFALSPGTGSGYGNPACAGPTACGGTGPRIIGAINTFNTPNGPVAAGKGALIGRGLHAISETGETGWIGVSANEYQPINTSSNSVPSSSASCSTFTGLSSLTGQCVSLSINSYTAHSVTGYEPYFASPASPFLGTPGELRTTQIGDTACVTTSTAGNCTYYNGTNELMTLVQKNPGGIWVFQRATYNAELALSGPLALWWESWQISTPPGSIGSQQYNVQVFWNPVSGCGGSPDPHGNCLIEDVNEQHNHAEWRNGGESQSTNVPEWGQPIWGWPFDYQAILGAVPCIFGLPFANVTPGQVTTDNCVNPAYTGINFVATEPPFAGVYGHPWGFDAGTHPNAAGANASAYESKRAFDNLPVQGGQNEPVFTAVSGQAQLYVATPASNIDADDIFGYGSIVAINRKLMATGASCGSHPVIDVSGPSASIASGSAGSYTYCIARAGGECYPGSTTGQVYVNCPGVISTSCAGSAIHGGAPLGVGNDICVGNIGNGANAIIQYSLDQTDRYGATRRALVSATARLRMVFGFENNQLLPDNSWILYRQESLNYQRLEMWMAKNLPYPDADSTNRGDFVAVPVGKLQGPPGTDNAIVEFGYQEYGAPQRINCTTRNDACITASTASTVPPVNQPFYFASENPAGAPCATGCTITVPAISQRVLYYQVKYRDASNKVLETDPPSALVVP
ncbi:MAG: hypothetical protein ABSF54_00930 [Bryobacteraceae bacterium]|jgi:hypothetical protein